MTEGTPAIVVLILIAVVTVPLFWCVHCGLERLYIRFAQRFCVKRGMAPSHWKCGPAFDDTGVKTEYSIVELDCQHPQDGRQFVRLLVWIFGVREVLAIEAYPPVLTEDLIGSRLDAATELLFAPSEEPGPPKREAIALRLGGRSLIVKALTDTSEIRLSLGELLNEGPDYFIRDASGDEPFRSFLGKPLRDWWVAFNDRGNADVFMIAFEATRGISFVAMNNEVSILTIDGEQWS